MTLFSDSALTSDVIAVAVSRSASMVSMVARQGTMMSLADAEQDGGDAQNANDDADSLSLSSRMTSVSASQRSGGRGSEKSVSLVAYGIASVG